MDRKVGLRNYRPSDIEAMCLLDNACFADVFRFDRPSMKSFVEAPEAIVVVVEDGAGAIVGFVVVHLMGSADRLRGYVVTLDVAEESRRKGLASHMMDEVERRARAAGARSMQLHVFVGNVGAIRFYERRGYERVGKRLEFYGAPGLDAFVYRRSLAEGTACQ